MLNPLMLTTSLITHRWAFVSDMYSLQLACTYHSPTIECDPVRFDLDPEESSRRRELFFELYTYDMAMVSLIPFLPGCGTP
jgi:hypothetical protein